MQSKLESRQYHIESDDFLGTEATKIEIAREYVSNKKFNIDIDDLLRDVSANLVYLQQNYIIVARETSTLLEDIDLTDRFVQNVILTFLLFNRKSLFMVKKKRKITLELEHYLKEQGLDVNTIAKLNVEGFTKLFDLNEEGFNAIIQKQDEIHTMLKKLVEEQKKLKKEQVRSKKDRPKK